MLIFSRILIVMVVLCSFIASPKISAQIQQNYLEGLFKEVEARESNPEAASPRMYDTLIKNSLSFKLLDKYPKLTVGKILFSPHLPKDLEGREDDIRKGQDLILNVLATPAMLRDSVTFKDLTHQIDLTFKNSQSTLQYSDWVLIASAFRTLSAPDSKEMPNALGIFITEYIVLMLIDDLEKKSNRTKEDTELLSTLYYILSQIYQNIINNPDEYYFVKKKKGKGYSPLYLALPKMYYTDAYAEDLYIAPITHGTISEYDIPYADPYYYSVFVSFNVTYDILVSHRLILLRTAVIVTPYYDVAWIPIIRYIAVDLRSPFYVERLTPVFWDTYFPLGIVGIQPTYIDKLYTRWERITVNNPGAISHQIHNPKAITNSFREIRNPEWRRKQERKEERGLERELHKLEREDKTIDRSLQESERKLRREERGEERNLQREQREQQQLERKQERLGREERRDERRLQQEQQEQLQPKKRQERLHREERGEERRIQREQREQQQFERKQERLGREERREERRIQKEGQEQRHLQQEQEKIYREQSQQKQMMEQKIEQLKSEEKREMPHPKQERRVPDIKPQKQTPSPQGGAKPGKSKH